MTRQIIAMGGGGFLMEPDNPALDQYILNQTNKTRPKVCFLPTASGDGEGDTLRFYEAFVRKECQPSCLTLFRLPTADLEGFILDKDVMYVGGGNTRSMLALWREWGIDIILRKAYEIGIVLAGISAGGNCWFEQCTTDSVPGQLSMMPCLGLLKGSFTPHYDGEINRRPTLHRLIKEGGILPGYGVDNSAALHFVNGELFRAVRSQPNAKAYQVRVNGSQVEESELEMVLADA